MVDIGNRQIGWRLVECSKVDCIAPFGLRFTKVTAYFDGIVGFGKQVGEVQTVGWNLSLESQLAELEHIRALRSGYFKVEVAIGCSVV